MSSPTFKAQALARNLQQNIATQVAGAVFTTSLDTNNNPILEVVASGETIFVQIMPASTDRIDSLGLPQNAYTPNISTILEATTPVSLAVRYAVEQAVILQGTQVLVYQIASLPSSFTLAGATLVATLNPDPINPLTDQI